MGYIKKAMPNTTKYLHGPPPKKTVMVSLFESVVILKDKIRYLLGDNPPPKEIKVLIRNLKLPECLNSSCQSKRLHGNGWRSRYVIVSLTREFKVWYWRIRCQKCGLSISLMPDIVIPDLYYHAETVSEVIVGRHNGQLWSEFEPSRQTQKRWMDRLNFWFPVAQSVGAIGEELKSWTQKSEFFLKAVLISASSHIGLFFPSHGKRRWNYRQKGCFCPALATHQSWTLDLATISVDMSKVSKRPIN